MSPSRVAWSLIVLLITLVAGPVQAQIYVDVDNTGGTQDGTAWSTAYADLQTAIDNASSGDEIWVAEGTYTPDSATDSIAFSGAKDGLEIYGGFDGTESTRSARDPKANVTVLSGDVDDNDAKNNDGVRKPPVTSAAPTPTTCCGWTARPTTLRRAPSSTAL